MNAQDFSLHKAAYSVNEVLDILPLGRTQLYAEVKAGRLRASKLGKKTLFLARDIIAFLENLPTKNPKSRNPVGLSKDQSAAA